MVCIFVVVSQKDGNVPEQKIVRSPQHVVWQHPACALLGLAALSRPEGFSTSAESSAPCRNTTVGFLFSPLQGEPGESGEPGLPGEVGLPVSMLRDVVERSFLSVVPPGSWWKGFWGGMDEDGD